MDCIHELWTVGKVIAFMHLVFYTDEGSGDGVIVAGMFFAVLVIQ